MAFDSIYVSACLLLSVFVQVTAALPKAPLILQGPFSAGGPPNIASSEFAGLEGPPRVTQRIAIIGSGITGASAAFTLAENARQNSKAIVPLITIFEQNPVIGGRLTTTQVYDEPELTIDTCAATFDTLTDTCIGGLARRVGLTATPVQLRDNGTAVWNGSSFVGFVEDAGFRDYNTWSPFKQARFGLRFGKSPAAAGQSTVETNYRTLGKSVFTSLSDELELRELNETVLKGACETKSGFCLRDAGGDRWRREVIEAGVRDRFFGDADELNELNSVLGLSSETSLSSVDGGNLRLIDRLIKLSGARLVLGSKVNAIELDRQKQWNITTTVDGGVKDIAFDKVIIAAPLLLAAISVSPEITVPLIDFADTVVTHFTSKQGISAERFNSTLPVPQTILSSATATEAGNKAELPFFSFRLLDNNIVPTNRTISTPGEKLYKIVSSRKLSDEEITSFLEPKESANKENPIITWINKEILHNSVPRLNRALRLQGDIEVAKNLFYAGGGAQVTDTIEFGCRMGRNAARLIVPVPVRGQPGNGL